VLVHILQIVWASPWLKCKEKLNMYNTKENKNRNKSGKDKIKQRTRMKDRQQ